MSLIDKADRFSAVKAAAPGDYSLPGAFESAAKAKPSRGGMGGTAPRTSAFVAGQAEGAVSATTYTAPSAFATPKKSSSKSAAFSSQSGRFASPAPQGPASTSYDITFGTMGASAKKSVNKSGTSGGFGGTAKRDPFGGAARAGTPRGSSGERLLRSDEVAPVVSSFGVKKVQSKGPSAAFAAGKKDRFAPKKDSTPDYGYAPAGMGSVKKSTAKSTTMGGKVGRFTPAKAAAPGDYSDAFTSDFSKSKMGKAKSNMGFGGTAPRVSAVEESAQAAAKNAPAKIYDGAYTSTGAFSKATTKEKAGPSAAFASKSRQQSDAPRTDGPAPGQYNTHAAGSMSAAKSFNKSVNAGGGSFGTSVARGSGIGSAASAAEATPGPGAYSAEAEAGFGGAGAKAASKPSAAFASASGAGSRLVTVDVFDAPRGVSYDAHKSDGMAATAAKTFSKVAAAGKGLGRSERMAPAKEAAPGDYTDALPGAFTASKSHSTLANTGFGGTASRASHFEEAAVAAAQAPDTYYVGAGAFTKATEPSGPSAAFASKSRQQSDTPRTDGPAPGQYNTHAAGSMSAAKSFNKSVNAGGGSFGTNAKRVTMPQEDDAPGPGAYDATDGGTLFSRDTFKPSAAFASQSEVRPELRSSAAPSGVAYDPHKADGMAAQTLKTFNSKAGTGGFGGVVPREYHTVKETPGPGEYTQADPNAPTVESKLNANKGKVSGAFASSSLRDSMDWGNMFNR